MTLQAQEKGKDSCLVYVFGLLLLLLFDKRKRQFGLRTLLSLNVTALILRCTLELIISPRGSITHHTEFLEQNLPPSFLNVKETLLGGGIQRLRPDLFKL